MLAPALLAMWLGATEPGGSLVFRDAKSCSEAVARGERLPRTAAVVRIVTWNVRWFPDGGPGKTESGRTNIVWLACALKWLDADAVVLQEIKRVPYAIEDMGRIVKALGPSWRVAVDDCADPSRQHLAFLHRKDRIDASQVTTRGEIDPTTVKNGTPSCPGKLRPAITAYLRSRRGGLDFHIAGVHLDSGKETHDQDDRFAAWGRITQLAEAMQRDVPDDDVIVLGDFNTMGCKGCAAATASDEITALADTAHHLLLPFRVASSEVGCTEYYRDHGAPLDHVLVSATMQEADDAVVRVSGICAALGCAKLDPLWLPAMTELSDHCPVLVDIPDQDLD